MLISCKQLQQSWQALLSWLSWSCHSIFGISDLRSTRSISSTCPNPFCGLVLVWCPQTWQLTAPPHHKIHSSPMTRDPTLHVSSTRRSHVTKCPRQLHMAQTTSHTNTIHLHLRPSPSIQIRPPARQRSLQYFRQSSSTPWPRRAGCQYFCMDDRSLPVSSSWPLRIRTARQLLRLWLPVVPFRTDSTLCTSGDRSIVNR